jgi:O-antigen/teichoic acid export membrane protein
VVALVGIWGVPWLFGSEFSQAVPVLEILLLGVVVGNPGSIAGAGLSARGRPELRSWSLVIAVAVNIGLLVLLVPMFGAIGAAWATAVGNLIAGGLNIVWLRVFFGIPISTFLAPRVSDFSFIGGVVRGQLQRFLPLPRK